MREEDRSAELTYREARTVYRDGREETTRAAVLAEHVL